MSNYLFLNHQSPVKKNPLVAQGVISPNSHLLVRPTSSKVRKPQIIPQNNNVQMYRNMQLQPQLWIDNIGYRPKNNSPIRDNLREEKVIPPQYNFQYIQPQKRDPGRISHTRLERTPHQIRISRDISPLARVSMVQEGGVDYPVRAVRVEDRNDKDGSWNKLLNRSQEQAVSRNQKLADWRKILEEQVREQNFKKQQEMERIKYEEVEAENRYQRQIEELSGEIEKRKRSLHKNGGLRQEPHVYPLSNASPLNQLSNNVNNVTSKSQKDLRVNREVLGQLHSITPLATNIRERRGKTNYKEENSAHLNYSAEKSRNESLNHYIDNLKAELFQGQEVFKSHIKDLKEEAYKLGKFRNVAERNLLGPQRLEPVKVGGMSSLPSHMIYRDIKELEDMTNASINLVESSNKTKRSKMVPPQQPEEEKFKWDTDDFFSKLPPPKQLITGAPTMVKIEAVTEDILAYKKPNTPIKKQIEEDLRTMETMEDVKRTSKESIQAEESVVGKENSEVTAKPKFRGFKKIDVAMTLKENRLVTSPVKTVEEQNKVVSSISSIPEARSTPKGNSKPGTQLSLGTPKNNEKATAEDYLQIRKSFQPLTMMLNAPGHGTMTPSIETGSRRDQILSMASRNEATRETKDIREKLETLNSNVNEETMEKEEQKMKRSTASEKELKKSVIRAKQVKKNDGTLKVLSKFVAKDGMEAKMADSKKLQSDPLARLDFMIDYLFNYDAKTGQGS